MADTGIRGGGGGGGGVMMSSKRSGASFRKAKRLKNLAADSEICSKIKSFFISRGA